MDTDDEFTPSECKHCRKPITSDRIVECRHCGGPLTKDDIARTCNHCIHKIKGDRTHRRKHLTSVHKAVYEHMKMMAAVNLLLHAASSSSSPKAAGRPDDHPIREARNMQELRPSERVAHMIVFGGFDPLIVDNEHIKNFMGSLCGLSAIEGVCDTICDEARQGMVELLTKQLQNKEEEEEEVQIKRYKVEVQSRPIGRVSLAVGKAKTLDREVLYIAVHFMDQKWKLHKVVLGAYVLVHDLPHLGPLSGVPEVYAGAPNDHMIVGSSLPQVDNLRSQLFMMAWGIPPSQDKKAMKDQLGKAFDGTFPVNMGLVSTSFVDHVLEDIAAHLRWAFLLFKRSITQELLDLNLTREECQQKFSRLHLEQLSAYDKNWYRAYCTLRILEDGQSSALIEEDAALADLLIKVFGEIYKAIQEISKHSCPTSNLCLRKLLDVRKALGSSNRDEDGHITKCLNNAKLTLDKAIKDSYLVWSVPLVLDPRYKLEGTRRILAEEYGLGKAEDMLKEVSRKLNDLYTSYSQDGGAVAMDIDSAGPSSEQAKTELEIYLKDEPVQFKGKGKADDNVPIEESCEILDWWKGKSGEYPRLARLARDALAMPTCSRISSEQMASIKSIIRGYSKKPFQPLRFEAKEQAPRSIASAAQDEEAFIDELERQVQQQVKQAHVKLTAAKEEAARDGASANDVAAAARSAAIAAMDVANAAKETIKTAKSTLAGMDDEVEAEAEAALEAALEAAKAAEVAEKAAKAAKAAEAMAKAAKAIRETASRLAGMEGEEEAAIEAAIKAAEEAQTAQEESAKSSADVALHAALDATMQFMSIKDDLRSTVYVPTKILFGADDDHHDGADTA